MNNQNVDVENKNFTMEDLVDVFEKAKEDWNFVGVLIEIPGLPDYEVIIHSQGNFDIMLESYQNIYDENLSHKYNSDAKIIYAAFGDTFEQIEVGLLLD